MDLHGKVIVITGAAQGLGQKMAEIVSGQGASSRSSTSITRNSKRRCSSAPKQAVRSKTTRRT